ncbi:hypothetical protein [Solitalea lacus]|uniref:hypothetical protein n=1 Tax=Solitalea lacus TaxID=2911172 RepID=UPI001EDB8994|nr:hypothetical protein [Solitalea lacus]UKJ06123.1 hypothetical protein L2B55_11250 [Solitalea lacus]
MNKFKFTRRELYDYIWKNPLTSLISIYNISYLELKQLLNKYEIPVPPNGYCSKLKAGQNIIPTPLSSNFKLEDVRMVAHYAPDYPLNCR